jgi:hypothetical protein
MDRGYRTRTLSAWVAAVLAAAVVAIALTALAPRVASAAAARPHETLPQGNFKVTYTKTWTFKSRPLHTCVVFIASGNITYTYSLVTGVKVTQYLWSNQSLNSPKLSVYYHPYKGKSCGKARARLSHVVIGQYWSGYSCSFNPSISVSAPWGISFGGWPGCQERNQAGYSSPYGRGTHAVQNNTGSQTTFGNLTKRSQSDYPCYGVYVSGQFWIGLQSDSYGEGNLHKSDEVCLSKS